MKDNTAHPIKWPFWLETAVAAVIPFVVWWRVTPTNILNSGNLWKLLEKVGIAGSVLILLAGIPVGILGLRAAKRMGKGRIPTMALSVVNLLAGILEVSMLLMVFCAVVFGGASV